MYTPVLPNELKLWQHQYGPEQVLNGLGGWLGADHLASGSQFFGGGWTREGGEVEAVDGVGGSFNVGGKPLLGAFFDGTGEGLAVGELDGLKRRQIGGPHGDNLITVGAAEGAH